MADAPPPIRVVVVDDEPMARASLRKLLAADSEIELVGECRNGVEAVEVLRARAPDLVFLDVHMPGMGGFEVVETLGEEEVPLVVFVTAYDQFALKAFEVHAVDYLLKPFDDERFRRALDRAKERLRSKAVIGVGRQLADLLATVGGGSEQPRESASMRRLSIHREGRVELIDESDVRWVEAADQYVKLHTTSGVHLMRESMQELERKLDPLRFVRIHRSAIVAIDCVRTLERQGSGGARVLLDDGEWLPVSRSRVASLRARLG